MNSVHFGAMAQAYGSLGTTSEVKARELLDHAGVSDAEVIKLSDTGRVMPVDSSDVGEVIIVTGDHAKLARASLDSGIRLNLLA